MAPAPSMWKSKLCNEYPKELIERLDAEHHRTLKRLRGLPENRRCADCAAPETNWASVNLGLFLCTRCASVHRGLGTHVSKVKSCMGTYLWGPDEIARMQEMGNARGARVYLGRADAGATPPPRSLGPETGDAALREWALKKYEQRLWGISEKEEAEKEEKKEAKAEAVPAEEAEQEKKKGAKAGTPPPAEDRILGTKKNTPAESAVIKPISGSAVAADNGFRRAGGAALAAEQGGARTAAVARPAPSLRQPKQPTGDFVDEFFESLFKEEAGATKKPIGNTPSEDFAACGFPEPAAWIQTPPAAAASLEKENTSPFLCAGGPKAAAATAAGNPFLSGWGAAVPVSSTPSVRKEAEQHGLAKPLAAKKAPAEIDWFEGW